MKSLLLSEIFPPKTGGSGRWFWEIYSRLPREGTVLAVGEDPRQEAFDLTHDLPLVRMPLALKRWGVRSWEGLRGYWGAVSRLMRLVRLRGIGMVHCGRVLPEGLMALALKWRLGLPYLCYVHGEDVTGAGTSREYSFLVHRVLRGAARIIANSYNTQRILCQEWQVPAEKVQVLHPGVDTTRFVPAAADAEFRRELGWGDRPVVLTVGRLQKRKGHDQMIAALPAIRQAVGDVLYAIAGEGEERPLLARLAAEAGVTEHVQFLGEIDDRRLIGCYQQCDLFILPNRQVGRDIEGFGMVLVEAQACGKPVIAGASGGTAETMDVGRTGRIVACETPEPIAAQVSELLLDRRRLGAMGEAARQFVVEHFDWQALAQEARTVFDAASHRAA